MSELSPEKAEKVRKLLNRFPIFKKEDVKRTLEEFYQMSVEKVELFPNQTLLTEENIINIDGGARETCEIAPGPLYEESDEIHCQEYQQG